MRWGQLHEVGTAEVGTAGVGTAGVGTAEVGTAEVHAWGQLRCTGGSRGSSLRSVELPRKKKKAARPSYSRVRHAGNVGGASQLVPSSAQENVRARA